MAAGSALSCSGRGLSWKKRAFPTVRLLSTHLIVLITDLIEYIEVNPYHKPKNLLDLNPRGLVPTLGYKGKPLYESVVIGEFLEDAFPSHGHELRPSAPYERAKTRLWTDYCTSRMIPAWHRFLQCQGNQDELEELRKEYLGHLLEFTKEMDEEGPWFGGREVGIVDLVVAPWAVSFSYH